MYSSRLEIEKRRSNNLSIEKKRKISCMLSLMNIRNFSILIHFRLWMFVLWMNLLESFVYTILIHCVQPYTNLFHKYGFYFNLRFLNPLGFENDQWNFSVGFIRYTVGKVSTQRSYYCGFYVTFNILMITNLNQVDGWVSWINWVKTFVLSTYIVSTKYFL